MTIRTPAVNRRGFNFVKGVDSQLGRPKVTTKVEHPIRPQRKKGVGMISIGKKLGVATSVVQRFIAKDSEVNE